MITKEVTNNGFTNQSTNFANGEPVVSEWNNARHAKRNLQPGIFDEIDLLTISRLGKFASGHLRLQNLEQLQRIQPWSIREAQRRRLRRSSRP